jgi:hypothetical protein
MQRILANGHILIPASLRQKYRLTPGRLVTIVDYGGSLGIVPVPENPIDSMHGMFSSEDESVWTDNLVDEHRRERSVGETRDAD